MTFPKRVMIVEDEVITQRYLKMFLEQYDTTVVACCDNATDAMNAIDQSPCDMVLVDINITGSMDGIQLSRRILEKCNVPIVFITAYSDEETVNEALELSPYGYVVKPFVAKELEISLQIAYKRFLTQAQTKSNKTKEVKKDIVAFGKDIRYILSTGILSVQNKPVKLNIKQQKLLSILVKNVGNTVDLDALHQFIWEDEYVSGSSLRTLVYSLRKLVPDLPIVSYSKVGYSLERRLRQR